MKKAVSSQKQQYRINRQRRTNRDITENIFNSGDSLATFRQLFYNVTVISLRDWLPQTYTTAKKTWLGDFSKTASFI